MFNLMFYISPLYEHIGSGEIDLVEFSFMMRSLASNNLNLLLKLGFPESAIKTLTSSSAVASVRPKSSNNGSITSNNNISSSSSRTKERYSGGNDAYIWRLRSFQAMDKDGSGGVSIQELTSWFIHELNLDQQTQGSSSQITKGEGDGTISAMIRTNSSFDLNSSNSNMEFMSAASPSTPTRQASLLLNRSSPSSSFRGSPSFHHETNANSTWKPPLVKASDLVTLRTRAGRLFMKRYTYIGDNESSSPLDLIPVTNDSKMKWILTNDIPPSTPILPSITSSPSSSSRRRRPSSSPMKSPSVRRFSMTKSLSFQTPAAETSTSSTSPPLPKSALKRGASPPPSSKRNVSFQLS